MPCGCDFAWLHIENAAMLQKKILASKLDRIAGSSLCGRRNQEDVVGKELRRRTSPVDLPGQPAVRTKHGIAAGAAVSSLQSCTGSGTAPHPEPAGLTAAGFASTLTDMVSRSTAAALVSGSSRRLGAASSLVTGHAT